MNDLLMGIESGNIVIPDYKLKLSSTHYITDGAITDKKLEHLLLIVQNEIYSIKESIKYPKNYKIIDHIFSGLLGMLVTPWFVFLVLSLVYSKTLYWILFAVMGWINILFPLIAITRGFITDTIRSAAMEQGLTPFGMQVNPICKFITGSRFMRISYAVAKVVAFVLIVAAKIPTCPNAELIWNIGYWSAVFAIIFCVVRGIPVVLEAKYLFEKK